MTAHDRSPWSPTRRQVLSAAGRLGAAGWLALAVPGAQAARPPAARAFDPGPVRHVLPSATHERLLLKVSFSAALDRVPTLLVGRRRVEGRRTDSRGEHATYDVRGLTPSTTHRLQLVDGSGRALTAPWPLRTFPHPDSLPERFRLACITCAGGRDEFIDPRPDVSDPTRPQAPVPQFQPLRVKRRLLARALAFAPDALHANGDHVYWDMRSRPTGPVQGMSPQAALIGPGWLDRTKPVRGTSNEQILKNAVGPQIADLYGVEWRSTPVFFVQDDHDYTENDEAGDLIRTFPPDAFMRDVSRTTQRFWYPELLPGEGLPRRYVEADGTSPDVGVLRYGRLLEAWIYNAKGRLNNTRDPQQPDHDGRTGPGGHPESRMVPADLERWLLDRTRRTPALHAAHVPSSPVLYGAGKFAEWYPDVLGDDGHLTLDEDKPYWPDGWNDQHDRLVVAASAQRHRVPLWISGDLHSSALGLMTRTRGHDLSANPVVSLISGTPGTGAPGFPSSFRGVKAEHSRTVQGTDLVAPVEENGFSLVDFTPSEVVVSMFRWDHRTQSEDEIDRLQPFAVHRFPRPGAG